MEEEEKSKGFKIDDRRRFSAEGELKPEHRGEKAADEPAAPSVAKAAPASGASGTSTAAAAPEMRQQDAGPLGELNFASFMVGLSSQALFHLGEIVDPQAGGPQVDLPAAQQLIDIVGMLKDKTRGNLDQNEQALIDEILFELRMKYVERSSR
ncbi:MAG TPA: DUF1844 domain-containing protein [Candidatus Binataceae bacterium]|nr:DUF1844 domain-containing protein [Candidatus Binataceae bacterium]